MPELRQGWLEDVPTTREVMSAIARRVEITDVGCPFTEGFNTPDLIEAKELLNALK